MITSEVINGVKALGIVFRFNYFSSFRKPVNLLHNIQFTKLLLIDEFWDCKIQFANGQAFYVGLIIISVTGC